jgi:hypothetical protein
MFPHRLATTFLAAGLLLSTLGCSKKDSPEPPAPAPSLEGNWNEDSYTTLLYDASGNITSQTSISYLSALGRYYAYLTFTGTTRQRFAADDNRPLGSAETYTLTGNVLTVAVTPATISTTVKQLSATTLTIRTQHPPTSQGSYTVYEQGYVRR